jgi:hypothetical protein
MNNTNQSDSGSGASPCWAACFIDGSISADDHVTVCFWRGSGDKRHLHTEILSPRSAFEIISAAIDASLPPNVQDHRADAAKEPK